MLQKVIPITQQSSHIKIVDGEHVKLLTDNELIVTYLTLPYV